MNKLHQWTQSQLCMGTVVSIKVVSSRDAEDAAQSSVEQAFALIRQVEHVCSRFDEDSEVRRLCQHSGVPIRVSDMLFNVIQFAWEVADTTGGVFDMTLGHRLESYGFNRHYLTEETTAAASSAVQSEHSYLDVVLDEDNHTILLKKPLLIDLGAVAKGFAVDLAVTVLNSYEGFLIDAGGDLYAGGHNESGNPWLIGIQHPFHKSETMGTLQLTNAAICTSGSYERPSPIAEHTHHLIDPHTGASPADIVSCTVIAPFAMMADAFSTAAFILGPTQGAELLGDMELEGLWITSALHVHMTKEMGSYHYEQ